jgi:hypothetical protein
MNASAPSVAAVSGFPNAFNLSAELLFQFIPASGVARALHEDMMGGFRWGCRALATPARGERVFGAVGADRVESSSVECDASTQLRVPFIEAIAQSMRREGEVFFHNANRVVSKLGMRDLSPR